VIGEAFDGQECIEIIRNRSITPDFVLMDHRMPVKNGFDATKILLEEFPKLRIIFISADLSVRNQVLDIGAVSFIKKPFNITTLFESIDNLLEYVQKSQKIK
jgi:two-component system chemotaxis response regulator CheY